MNADQFNRVARDVGCTVVGLGGITYQIVTWKISEALLLTCAGLLGVPGVAGLLSLRSGGNAGTTSPSPSSPEPSSPASSPSPSPTRSAGER